MINNTNISDRRIPRQHRSRQTVEAVLAAVPLVVKRHGVASITTNRIAEVAGVSIGSLYQYFPDKTAIFSALHERHVGDVQTMLERYPEAHRSSSFNEFAVDLVEELVDLHSVETELHQVICEPVSDGPEYFRRALRCVMEQPIERCGSESTNRILSVLPSMIEGVVHGVTLPSFTPREAKGEAVRAIHAYLSAHPELRC
jgi:AcrR family transcriptional regulator